MLNGKRALASPDKYLGDVETMLEHCLQRGIDIQGKRVDSLAAQCKNYGIELSGMSPEISVFSVSYEVKE